jgi:hypothetical protein
VAALKTAVGAAAAMTETASEQKAARLELRLILRVPLLLLRILLLGATLYVAPVLFRPIVSASASTSTALAAASATATDISTTELPSLLLLLALLADIGGSAVGTVWRSDCDDSDCDDISSATLAAAAAAPALA